MEQRITVYDGNNTVIGTTFKRRAKQLVNKRRAKWSDGECTAICLSPEKHEEDLKMDTILFEQQTNDYKNEYEKPSSAPRDKLSYENESLLFLARRNVTERKSLLKHVGVNIISWIFLLMLIASDADAYLSAFLMGCLVAWDVSIAIRIVKLAFPQTKDFFSRKRGDPVEMEYARLKSMNPERIALEYERG